MRAFLVVVLLVVVGLVGLGFARGWFGFTSDSTDAESNVTLTVDKDKFDEDRQAATQRVRDLGGQTDQAEDVAEVPASLITDGTLVSLRASELTITDQEDLDHQYTLAPDVTITCDGEACQAADLQAGMRVRVTTSNDAPRVANRIEALDNNPTFE